METTSTIREAHQFGHSEYHCETQSQSVRLECPERGLANFQSACGGRRGGIERLGSGVGV